MIGHVWRHLTSPSPVLEQPQPDGCATCATFGQRLGVKPCEFVGVPVALDGQIVR